MSRSGPEEARQSPGTHDIPADSVDPTPRGAQRQAGRAKILCTVAGILAGMAAFGIGEAAAELVPAESVRVNVSGHVTTLTSRETPRVSTLIAAVAYAGLGLCLGAGMGIAGGLVSHRAASILSGGSVGAVLGAAACGGVALGLIPALVAPRILHPDADILIGFALHGPAWGLAGAAAGLAFAVGLGRYRLIGKAVAAGLVGAVLGTIVYELLGAAVDPIARTTLAISTTAATRLLARLLVSVGTAVLLIAIMPTPPSGLPDEVARG